MSLYLHMGASYLSYDSDSFLVLRYRELIWGAVKSSVVKSAFAIRL